MAVQQEISADEIHQIVETAAHRNAPIALTCRKAGTWQSYRSRFLGLRGGQVWVEYGTVGSGQESPEFAEGQRVGIAFKQRHFKYVFSTDISAVREFYLDAGRKITGLRLAWPTDMHQLQRRIFNRVDVPDDCQIFAHFWEGGLEHEPTEPLREKLIHFGQLTDLSGGGFRIRLLSATDPGFQSGSAIGADLHIDGEPSVIKVDAQYRHVDIDEFGITLGMKLLGLTETSEGRKKLSKINKLLRRFQRPRRRRLRQAG